MLDGERKIAYHGLIDDGQNPDKVKTQHLRLALDAILAGRGAKAEVLAFGCTIKYDN